MEIQNKMYNCYDTLEQLSSITGYWSDRILAELEYATKLSKINGGAYDNLIKDAVHYLNEKSREEGVISRQAALYAERMIKELSSVAKSYKLRLLAILCG
jgi:alpha-mannosidase